MFASGSLDGTIVVWNAETFSPVQTFNCVDDYQGDDRMYRYSIQHMTAVEGVRQFSFKQLTYTGATVKAKF